jgi:hypothetical protein
MKYSSNKKYRDLLKIVETDKTEKDSKNNGIIKFFLNKILPKKNK